MASFLRAAGWLHGYQAPRVQVNPEDPCMIQFTGGTTGIPKAAVLTHANLVAATFQCALWGSSTTNLTHPNGAAW
jgi:long-chain acyl-CoA synthetase